MNRPWRDCAARNIRISASAKYFRKKRRARRLPVSNRQIPTRRKSCAADKVSLWRNRPAGVERLHSTPQTSNVRRPGFAGRRTFLRSKTRRANLYAPSPQAPPLRIWLHKARPPPTPNALTRREYSPGRVSVSAQMTPLHPSPIAANAPASRRAQCAARAHPLPAHRMMLALGHTFSWVCLQAFPLPLERALPCSACKRSEPVRACVWIAYPYPCKQRPVLLLNRRGCAGFAARTTCCRGLSPSCVRRIACVKIAFS